MELSAGPGMYSKYRINLISTLLDYRRLDGSMESAACSLLWQMIISLCSVIVCSGARCSVMVLSEACFGHEHVDQPCSDQW